MERAISFVFMVFAFTTLVVFSLGFACGHWTCTKQMEKKQNAE